MTLAEQKLFINLVHEYIKTKGKMWQLEDLKQYHPVLELFFKQIPEKELLELLLKDFRDRLTETRRAKTIKELFLAYTHDKKVWEDFFILNCKRAINDPDFKRLWITVYRQLQEIEDRVIGTMETGKYKEFSTSLSDKYWNIVKEFFPYYQLSQVTTR